MKFSTLLIKATTAIAFIFSASVNQSTACDAAFTGNAGDEVDAGCVGAPIDPATVTGALVYLTPWLAKNCDKVGVKATGYVPKSTSKATAEQCSISAKVIACKQALNSCITAYEKAKTAAGEDEAKKAKATENKTKCEDGIKLKACKTMEAIAVVPE